MPIIDLQRRFRELGRLRMGDRVDTGKVKDGQKVMRPRKLATWRITTQWRHLLEAAIELGVGGDIEAFTPETGRSEWALTTTASSLDVLIPPGEPLTQWMEAWEGGGILRRCDAVNMLIAGGHGTDRPCQCKAEVEKGADQLCKPTTRLNVMLPGLPDLGVWRLETHGWHGASELAGSAELVATAARRGVIIPAELRIEKRRVKRKDQPVKDFAVPVLTLSRFKLADTLAALGVGFTDGPLALPVESRPALTAGGVAALPPASRGGTTLEQPATVTPPARPTDGKNPTGEPEHGDTPATPTTIDEPDDVAEGELVEPPAAGPMETNPEHPPVAVPTPPPFVPPDPIDEDEATQASGQPGKTYTPAQAIAIAAREAGIDETARHALIRIASDGRTGSGKDLDRREIDKAIDLIKRVAARTCTYIVDGDTDEVVFETERAIATVTKDGAITRTKKS